MPKISKQQHGSDNKNGSTGLLVSSQVIAANEALLTQILIPLPVKSLLHFESLLKDWLSLISSPHFRRCKSKQLSKNISGLILESVEEKDGSKFEFKYEYLPLDEKDEQAVAQSQRTSPLKRLDFLHSGTIRVVEYCNGLLLCKDSFELECEDCKYHVFNPSTNEYTTVSLDRVLESGKVHKVDSVSLAFDPRKSLHYRFICLYFFDLDDDSYYEVGVYSSETGLLKISGCPIQRGTPYFNQGVYWNGAVNWVGSWDEWLYFNVEEERWGTLPLPPVLLDGGERSEDWEEYGRWIMYYGESNDHLHLIEHYNIFAKEIDVYELDKGYSGWFVRFRVDLQPVFSFFQNLSYKEVGFPGIVCIVRKEQDEKSFLVLRKYGKAFRLNFEDMSLAMICDSASAVDSHDPVPDDFFCQNSVQFIESLHPLQFYS